MYSLDMICNQTMKEYYLMTILDLEDGLELGVVEKAVEDLWEDERYPEAIGLYWAVEEFKSNIAINNLINGEKED